jgi:GAF domain-containing protein
MLLQIGLRALLAVPLIAEDQLVGALIVMRKRSGTFEPEEVALLQTFATQSALAIQNARTVPRDRSEETGSSKSPASTSPSSWPTCRTSCGLP